MKAISITQPWASAIAAGIKKIETRGWKTKYRGLIAIHAAKHSRKVPPFSDPVWQDRGLPTIVTYGKVIALAYLLDVVSTEDLIKGKLPNGSKYKLSDREKNYGDYSPGRYGFILDRVISLDESHWIPARGALSLWNWPYKVMHCDQCDGCGWYEGGKTIKTLCNTCGGSGVVVEPETNLGGEVSGNQEPIGA